MQSRSHKKSDVRGGGVRERVGGRCTPVWGEETWLRRIELNGHTQCIMNSYDGCMHVKVGTHARAHRSSIIHGEFCPQATEAIEHAALSPFWLHSAATHYEKCDLSSRRGKKKFRRN
jgi:hypothetical protein